MLCMRRALCLAGRQSSAKDPPFQAPSRTTRGPARIALTCLALLPSRARVKRRQRSALFPETGC